MERPTPSKKSRILQALAAGQSCEQLLAHDRTLYYHDIFHAIAEAPTSYWRKNTPATLSPGWSDRAHPDPKLANHRTD
jgi:hypothetical protein